MPLGTFQISKLDEALFRNTNSQKSCLEGVEMSFLCLQDLIFGGLSPTKIIDNRILKGPGW